jgi:hypothetical protein
MFEDLAHTSPSVELPEIRITLDYLTSFNII